MTRSFRRAFNRVQTAIVKAAHGVFRRRDAQHVLKDSDRTVNSLVTLVILAILGLLLLLQAGKGNW